MISKNVWNVIGATPVTPQDRQDMIMVAKTSYNLILKDLHKAEDYLLKVDKEGLKWTDKHQDRFNEIMQQLSKIANYYRELSGLEMTYEESMVIGFEI